MGAVSSLAGEYERALAIYRELKPILIEARGLEHADVLTVLRNEGLALRSLQRYEEALIVLEEAIEIAVRMHGEEHPQTARSRADYGTVLLNLKRYAAAENNLVRAFEFCLEDLGQEHPKTRNIAEWLTRLFEETGKPDQADLYRSYSGK
jgi:tetratricopeptide (TPR) repeat protein